MGWFEGMLTGFQGRHYDIEKKNVRQAELQHARESKVFEALQNSTDEEVKALAATGLFTAATGAKKKSGRRGWLGDMESNPILGRMPELLRQGKTTTTTNLSITQSMPFISIPTQPTTPQQIAGPAPSGPEAL